MTRPVAGKWYTSDVLVGEWELDATQDDPHPPTRSWVWMVNREHTRRLMEDCYFLREVPMPRQVRLSGTREWHDVNPGEVFTLTLQPPRGPLITESYRYDDLVVELVESRSKP